MPYGDKFAVLPSRATQVIMKQKLAAGRNGLNLLKRKQAALDMKLNEFSAELEERKGALRKMMRTAYLGLARASFLGFDFQSVVLSTCDNAEVLLLIKYWNVVGIKLPHFQITQQGHESYPLSGLARGGHQVGNIRRDFMEVLNYLAEVASLRYSVKVLKQVARSNNMRVNGLEYVLIPKFENTLRFILEELDEIEREDFYRIKVSKAKHGK